MVYEMLFPEQNRHYREKRGSTHIKTHVLRG